MLGIVQGSRERVQDATDGLLLLLELLDDISLAVAAVDDDGQVELAGEPEVAVEPILLLGERGMIPVAVQAGLADGGHPAMRGQLDDPLPVVGLASATWLGWTPTAAKTPGWPAAISTTCALSAAVVPMATIWTRPAPRARSSTPSRSVLQAVVVEVGVGVDERALHGGVRSCRFHPPRSTVGLGPAGGSGRARRRAGHGNPTSSSR